MTGRSKHGGIFSVLSRRDLNTIKDFYTWVEGPLELGIGTGLSPEQVDDILTDNIILGAEKDEQAVENIDSATLDEIEEALEDHIGSLIGESSNYSMLRHMVPLEGGRFGWSDKIQKGHPEVEVAYGAHKRWAAELRKIVNKIKKYKDKLQNKELS